MSEFNKWFLSLPEKRQAILQENKWMLAENAFEAGKRSAYEEDKVAACKDHGCNADELHVCGQCNGSGYVG